MSKEVTKQEANEVVVGAQLDAWGDAQVSGRDIVIPKILAMQAMSKQVTEGHAKMGEFLDSLSNTVVGDLENPIELIPFHLDKQWIVSIKKEGKFTFEKFEPVTLANEARPWEEVIEGKEYKFEKCFNFYCLRTDDRSLPYLVSFKSTSMKSGRELATQMYIKNRAGGKVPPAKVMQLYGERVTNPKGTFIVMKTRVVRDSSQEEISDCLDWFNTINEGSVQTDQSDVSKEEGKPQF